MALVTLCIIALCLQIATGQYENVALRKSAVQSSVFYKARSTTEDAARAVDGVTTAHDPTGQYTITTNTKQDNAWWKVYLEREVVNSTISIYFRTDYKYRRNGVEVYTSQIGFSGPPTGQPCHTVSGKADGTDIDAVYNVTDCTGTWRHLMIYTQTDNDNKNQGPVLDFVEVQVLVPCSSISYGPNCAKQCSSRHCAVTPSTCDPTTGACVPWGCQPGYRGTDCAQECPANTYGDNCGKSCSSRQCAVTDINTCDHITGACPGGCLAGYTGTDCTQRCSAGVVYGAGCGKSCSDRNCVGDEQNCPPVTGQCLRGCKAGYQQPDCTVECHVGTYGVNCGKSCSSRQCADSTDINTCGIFTGACPSGGCQAGYTGTDCTQLCTAGSYGQGCSGNCTARHCRYNQGSSCPHITGACSGGCDLGYMGDDCVTACTSGSYGQDCQEQCSSRHCVTSSPECHHQTGMCVGGCQAGWRGDDCTQTCSFGTYGRNCSKNCSDRKCQTLSGSCNMTDGHCPPDGCEPGFRGDDCTSQCPTDTFGFGVECIGCSTRHCKGESDCPTDGRCSGGCDAGWRLDSCTSECVRGRYGAGCESQCGNCSTGDVCHHQTGHCTSGCQPGWEGDLCKTPCSGLRYGAGCSQKCGQCRGTCHSESGLCSAEGCQDGFNGTMCQQRLKGPEPESDNTAAIAGGIVAAILVIVIIVVIFFILRRRKRPSESKYHHTGAGNGSMSIGNDNHAYESSDKKEGISSVGTVGPMYVNAAMVSEESVKAKPTVKPLIQKKPDIHQPAKKKIETDAVPEEEMLEGEEVITNDYKDYKVTRKVKVEDLADAIQKIKSHAKGFEAEFSHLPSGFSAPYNDSQKPENAGKNRFRGYYPYDHNRIRLTPLPNDPNSDYINASLMHSSNQKKTYIAAQAPNPKTVGDFWRMIWEHECHRIVMLTGLSEGGKVKCHQYWQKDDGDLTTDQFTVTMEAADERANYTIRHLKVTSKKTNETRVFVQYHYTSWPDHGVPDTLALVNFLWMMRHTPSQTDTPLLVHCSAGIGRTGTYIAVDSLLDQAREEGVVDVMGYVSVMRGQRKNMIQTKEQYECVFECLLEMTQFGNTSMAVENFTTSYSSRGMDSMVDRKTLREITRMAVAEDRPGKPDKHRLWVDGNQDFMVRIGPTLTHLRGYLQAVTPALGQEKLLWKLVEDRDAQNIVLLSPGEPPYGNKGSSKSIGSFTVTTVDEESLSEGVSVVTLSIKASNHTQKVTVYHIKGESSLVNLAKCVHSNEKLQRMSVNSNPTVIVHSESDRKNAAFYCILGNIASGILIDRRVDVIGHIRTFLKCCPGVALSEQDVQKMFEFAEEFARRTPEGDNVYANM